MSKLKDKWTPVKLKDGDVFSFTYNNDCWNCAVVGDRVLLTDAHGMSETSYPVSRAEEFLNDKSPWVLTTPITNKHEKGKTVQEAKLEIDNKLSITQDIYFDVAKHAKAWGVKHEEASKIIQKELFKTGRKWRYNHRVGTVAHTSELYLYAHADDNDICWGDSRSLYPHPLSHAYTKPCRCLKETY